MLLPFATTYLCETRLSYYTATKTKYRNGIKRCTIWAFHKVRHTRGGGGPRRCDSLRQGEGGPYDGYHMTLHFSNFFTHMKPKIESDV